MTNEEYLLFVEDSLEKIKSIIKTKNRDYTSGSGDALFNLRGATQLGLTPMHGLALRMGDKFNRLQTFIKTGSLAVKGEGAEDVFKDMIGYSLMGLALLSETTDKDLNLEFELDESTELGRVVLNGYNKTVSKRDKKPGTKKSGSGSKQTRDTKGGKLRGSSKR
jgi:hypothetical protein